MGDMGEFWKDVKPEFQRMSRDKRAKNRKHGEKENVRNARRVARRSSGVLNVAALENGHFMGIIVIDGARRKKTFGSITEAVEWVERLK